MNLEQKIIRCKKCPRLIAHCKKMGVEKRKAFADETYWAKPVPNFGEDSAELLIVGLAPAAHGANRTGRMFTGDRSGDWLYRALYEAGFATQAESTAINDGLTLMNTRITAVAHCAPPDNKPTRKEIDNCESFLLATFRQTNWKVCLALGGISWNACYRIFKELNIEVSKKEKFTHLQSVKLSDGRLLLGSYHPSQQNTFTKRLTKPMFDAVFREAKRFIEKAKN